MQADTPDDLVERATAWLRADPDPTTRAELEALLERVGSGDGDARAELADRFDGTLEFGTAGLRGAIGAGPNRMNRVVVLRAAAGLAAYLRDTGTPEGSTVVIGYDARHLSDVLARDTAEVVAGPASGPSCCRARCPRPCWPSRSPSSAARPGSW